VANFRNSRSSDFLPGPCALAKKKAAAEAGKHQHRDVLGIATSSGHRAGDAEKILQMRKSYGAFKSVDDLLAIRGLGPKRLEKMRKYLTVGKPAPAKSGAPGEVHSSVRKAARHTIMAISPTPRANAH